MSDIFFSYAREDEGRVKPIVEQFKRLGWGVFWDRNIPPGEIWDDYIEKHLVESRCVVVAWSENSVKSEWVKAEASEGRDRKILVPLRLDNVRPPLAFRAMQSADLIGWESGDAAHSQLMACVDAISRLLGSSPIPMVNRPDPPVSPDINEPQLPENYVLVRGGEFEMGSPESEEKRSADETQHRVRVSDFAMCRFAVTVGEFRKFIESSGYRTDAEQGDGSVIWTGSEWKSQHGVNWRHGVSGRERGAGEEGHPVLHVSWNDAEAYSRWLTEGDGRGGSYRLPTEAEWEYACRGGTKTPFNTGENLTTDQANYDGNYPYGKNPTGVWRKDTVAVDAFEPNGYGLYNMHGNVWEWCSDWYGSEYYEECRKKGVEENPQGPEGGSNRVLRGGGWHYNAQYCRSANRSYSTPGNRYCKIGFRLVFVPQFKR